MLLALIFYFSSEGVKFKEKYSLSFLVCCTVFSSAKINQSEEVIPDIHQSPSSIFGEEKKCSKRENSGCTFIEQVFFRPLSERNFTTQFYSMILRNNQFLDF